LPSHCRIPESTAMPLRRLLAADQLPLSSGLPPRQVGVARRQWLLGH
jgi:hypothetical protein